jgi:hypothetical protein
MTHVLGMMAKRTRSDATDERGAKIQGLVSGKKEDKSKYSKPSVLFKPVAPETSQ